ALTLAAALHQRGLLIIRPEPELDDFFLEVDPAPALRGLELRARDVLWRAWGVRGARLAMPLTDAWRDERARFTYRKLASDNRLGAVAARGVPALPVELALCLLGARRAFDSNQRRA